MPNNMYELWQRLAVLGTRLITKTQYHKDDWKHISDECHELASWVDQFADDWYIVADALYDAADVALHASTHHNFEDWERMRWLCILRITEAADLVHAHITVSKLACGSLPLPKKKKHSDVHEEDNNAR